MNQITICNRLTQETDPIAEMVGGSITKEMTPKEFDDLISQIGFRKIKTGGGNGTSVLSWASIQGNTALIRHIVQIEGKDFLGQGNWYGWTPLFYVAWGGYTETPNDQYLAAKELLELGADPNLATALDYEDAWYGRLTPRGSTPLWATAEYKPNAKLIRLLLVEHGAVIPPRLSPEGAQRIREVFKEITQLLPIIRLFGKIGAEPSTLTQTISRFCFFL